LAYAVHALSRTWTSQVLGFVIGSFDVQNLFLCFWGLGSFVLGSAVKNFEELLQKDKYKG
jgi:hypothetical protein